MSSLGYRLAVVLQQLLSGERRLISAFNQAATPNKFSTNFACPAGSLPSNYQPAKFDCSDAHFVTPLR
jgi:hypothetical protein